MIELLEHVLRQNHEFRNKHTEAMTHLANALNQNQRLKREMWRLRRAAGEVCDEVASIQPAIWVTVHGHNLASAVRALSDAIGREPR